MRILSSIAVALVLAVAMALVAVGPAGAIAVSGEQKVKNESLGRFKMKGSLRFSRVEPGNSPGSHAFTEDAQVLPAILVAT